MTQPTFRAPFTLTVNAGLRAQFATSSEAIDLTSLLQPNVIWALTDADGNCIDSSATDTELWYVEVSLENQTQWTPALNIPVPFSQVEKVLDTARIAYGPDYDYRLRSEGGDILTPR